MSIKSDTLDMIQMIRLLVQVKESKCRPRIKFKVLRKILRMKEKLVPNKEFKSLRIMKIISPRYVRLNHSENQIIDDKNRGAMTRRRIIEEYYLIYKIKCKNVDEACKDENWVKEME